MLFFGVFLFQVMFRQTSTAKDKSQQSTIMLCQLKAPRQRLNLTLTLTPNA